MPMNASIDGRGLRSPHAGGSDQFRVSRRFPWGAALWVVGCIAVAGFIGAVILNAYVHSRYRDFPNMGYAWLGVAAMLAGVVYYLPTVIAFLFGPSPFIIDRNGFQFGRRRVDFQDIAGFRHDAGRNATQVLLKDGTRIKLRWLIWRDSASWLAMLEERSYPFLLSAALADIKAGGWASFGSKLALDQASIRINGRTMPLGAVSDFHFADISKDGDEARKLRIRAGGRRFVIDERKIVNPTVFAGLFKTLAEGEGQGIAAARGG